MRVCLPLHAFKSRRPHFLRATSVFGCVRACTYTCTLVRVCGSVCEIVFVYGIERNMRACADIHTHVAEMNVTNNKNVRKCTQQRRRRRRLFTCAAMNIVQITGFFDWRAHARLVRVGRTGREHHRVLACAREDAARMSTRFRIVLHAA